MDYVLIILSSVTHARRVQKECEKRGIFAAIGHTPKKIASRGCSFMVKVKQKDYAKTLDIINSLMLKI
ncbi:MAG: DUF3343 domain-containing protein, partial [Clostridia bacterium]|nr:DUF3343 domain-containing protein [Clostridia bacterium]